MLRSNSSEQLLSQRCRRCQLSFKDLCTVWPSGLVMRARSRARRRSCGTVARWDRLHRVYGPGGASVRPRRRVATRVSIVSGIEKKDDIMPKCGPPAKMPKKRCRAAADQAATTTVAAAVNSRAPTQPTHHTRAPLQDFADVRSRMAMESQRQQRHAAAASHLSADSGSSVFLLVASAYRIRLRQRCLIIATRPRPVCSESTVVPLSPLDRIAI